MSASRVTRYVAVGSLTFPVTPAKDDLTGMYCGCNLLRLWLRWGADSPAARRLRCHYSGSASQRRGAQGALQFSLVGELLIVDAIPTPKNGSLIAEYVPREADPWCEVVRVAAVPQGTVRDAGSAGDPTQIQRCGEEAPLGPPKVIVGVTIKEFMCELHRFPAHAKVHG